jgi:hypothetical protein
VAHPLLALQTKAKRSFMLYKLNMVVERDTKKRSQAVLASPISPMAALRRHSSLALGRSA